MPAGAARVAVRAGSRDRPRGRARTACARPAPARLAQEATGRRLGRTGILVAHHGDDQRGGGDPLQILQGNAARFRPAGDAAGHRREDQLRGRKPVLRRRRRRGPWPAAHPRDGRSSPRATGRAWPPCRRRPHRGRLHQRCGGGRGIGRLGAVHLLEAREQDQPTLADEMVDPGAVAPADSPRPSRAGTPPPDGRLRAPGWKHRNAKVGALGEGVEGPLGHAHLAVAHAPRPVVRLDRRARRLAAFATANRPAANVARRAFRCMAASGDGISRPV